MAKSYIKVKQKPWHLEKCLVCGFMVMQGKACPQCNKNKLKGSEKLNGCKKENC